MPRGRHARTGRTLVRRHTATNGNDTRWTFLARIREEIAGLRQGMAEPRAELRDQLAGVREGMAEARANQLKWMFGFWSRRWSPWQG